jgi:hypothetical protein
MRPATWGCSVLNLIAYATGCHWQCRCGLLVVYFPTLPPSVLPGPQHLDPARTSLCHDEMSRCRPRVAFVFASEADFQWNFKFGRVGDEPNA